MKKIKCANAAKVVNRIYLNGMIVIEGPRHIGDYKLEGDEIIFYLEIDVGSHIIIDKTEVIHL